MPWRNAVRTDFEEVEASLRRLRANDAIQITRCTGHFPMVPIFLLTR